MKSMQSGKIAIAMSMAAGIAIGVWGTQYATRNRRAIRKTASKLSRSAEGMLNSVNSVISAIK